MGRPGLRHVLEEHPIVVGGAHSVPTARGYSSMPPFHAMLACFSRRRYGPPYPRLRFIVPSILARFPTARCPSSPGANAVPAGHVQRRVETRASPDSRSGLV